MARIRLSFMPAGTPRLLAFEDDPDGEVDGLAVNDQKLIGASRNDAGVGLAGGFDGRICEHYAPFRHRYEGIAFDVCARLATGDCMYCRIVHSAVTGTCNCRLFNRRNYGLGSPHACDYLRCRGGLFPEWSCGSASINIRTTSQRASQDMLESDLGLTSVHLQTHMGRAMVLTRGGEVHADPLSRGAIRLYSSWINRCNEGHACCRTGGVVEPPRRLLDLGLIPSDDTQFLRLCHTRHTIGSCEYMALSYCWGKEKPLMTTKATQAQHQRGIEYAKLPQMYKDAARLTRTLGVRYLWIDALCITQDDKEEWDAETSRMGSIFSNACLVIVAANADNVDVGFAAKRSSSSQWTECGSNDWSAYEGCVQARVRIPHYSDACEDTAIERRAWTYQERLLASRCLVFNEYEAVWECSKGCSCECRADHTPYDPQFLPRDPTLTAHESCEAEGDVMEDTISPTPLHTWERYVLEYSSRRLSVATDKLPAIAAVAATLAVCSPNDSYFAGLWRSQLIQQLLWYRVGTPRPAPPDYVAPSWSWASISSKVHFQHDWPCNEAEGATLIDAWCKLAGHNAFGAVSDGAVVLDALSCDTSLEEKFDDYGSAFHTVQVLDAVTPTTIPLRVGSSGALTWDTEIKTVTHPRLRDAITPRRDPQEACDPQWPRKPVHGCVRLLLVSLKCWLLLSCVGNDPEVYERIGVLVARDLKDKIDTGLVRHGSRHPLLHPLLVRHSTRKRTTII